MIFNIRAHVTQILVYADTFRFFGSVAVALHVLLLLILKMRFLSSEWSSHFSGAKATLSCFYSANIELIISSRPPTSPPSPSSLPCTPTSPPCTPSSPPCPLSSPPCTPTSPPCTPSSPPCPPTSPPTAASASSPP